MRKKLVPFLVGFLLITGIPYQASASTQGKITADMLNIRSGPGTGYSTIGTLYEGQTISVETEQNGWSNFVYNGKSAWVSSQYVNKASNKLMLTSLTSIYSSKTGKSEGVLAPQTVTVVENSGDGWYLIQTWLGNKWIKPNIKESSTSTAESKTTYKVQAGDTLFGIGSKFNVSVSSIKSANHLTSDVVFVGQNLTISGSTSTTPTVQKLTLTKLTSVYSSKTGKAESVLAPQTVTVVENSGDGWCLIQTWLGNKWIKPNVVESSTTTSTPSTTTKKGQITASVLNIRSGAGSTYSVVGTVSNGAIVTYTDSSNGWLKITYNGVTGWVSDDYVKNVDSSTTTPTAPPVTTKQAQVTADTLNVRSGAGASYSLVGTLKSGNVVSYSQTSNGWAYITYGTLKGWVSQDYLGAVGSTTLPPSSGSKGKTIVLDAGHGGNDPGSIGVDGTHEATITLQIALKAQQALINQGYKVVMVRTTDKSCRVGTDVSAELKCRADMPQQYGANIYISIHTNIGPSSARGSETYYNSSLNPYPTSSKSLANAVHNAYQPVFGSLNRGVQTAEYYVVKRTTVPSILLEVGFGSNSSDLSKLKSSTMQQSVANAIAKGVNNYFGY